MSRKIFFLFLAFFLVISGGRAEEEVSGERGPGYFQETKGFFLTETEEGKPKWDIKAQSASFSGSGGTILEEVEVVFYEKGEKFVTVTADKGVYDRVTRDVVLEGNVVGTAKGGERLSSHRLQWVSSEGRLFTEDRVKISGQDMVIEGFGMDFFSDLKKVVLKNKVRVEISGRTGDFPLVMGR